ncbi:hypothetical protein BVC93_26825 [Mycobacterium sp. MS1601]|nr:hypothetical protein [Mycobacterium sp. MS1601]AQA06749.1 hypothetical protein BVC93_26825 [Mycobacterium sp. MS1601]
MNIVWLYMRVQLAVFVCGIVGPIFLIVFFAAQPDPTIKWMYYAGLVITAVDVIIALLLTSRYADSRNQAVAKSFSP